VNDRSLYDRGAATLVASWEQYAGGSDGAAVVRAAGVAAAVFPAQPERAVYNNALLSRDLGAAERAKAVDFMESAYERAGVDRFAAWVHDSDRPMIDELTGRGYRLAETTRWMAMSLGDLAGAVPDIDLAAAGWADYLRVLDQFGVPAGIMSGVDPEPFHVTVARLDGENVAAALAYDHNGDCGIYNVGTLERARRRGLGTALSALQLHAALARGCTTASLQSTAMAEGIYAAVGFRDLGRILEYVPA
jgi:ribosomal protein S18 acetylase RimI-like enzyme